MGGPKRKQQYYKGGGAKKYKGAELQHGVTGFIFSFVKDRERGAKSEAFELLNSYAADVFGKPSNQVCSDSEDSDEADGNDGGDIDAALTKQVAKLKQPKRQENFTYLDTGVNQVLFMKSLVEDHNKLTYRILDDALNGKLQTRSRFLHRMLPVLGTCRADMDKIGGCVSEVLTGYISSNNTDSLPTTFTYKAEVKVRNNNDSELSRMSIITLIGGIVKERYAAWRVDLSTPDLVIMVDILKKVCCVSVLKDYLHYKKFNIQELVAEYHTDQTLSTTDKLRVKVKSGVDSEVCSEKQQSISEPITSIQETEPKSDTTVAASTESSVQLAESTLSAETEDTADKNKEDIALTAGPVTDKPELSGPVVDKSESSGPAAHESKSYDPVNGKTESSDPVIDKSEASVSVTDTPESSSPTTTLKN